MKRIYSSPITGEIPRLRNMLESAGIACFLRNEISSGLYGKIPVSESTPELWIEDDQRLAEALQIKAEFLSPTTAVGKDWQCGQCGEFSEAQFTSCWKCGAVREDLPLVPPVTSVPRVETVAILEKKEAVIEEAADGVPCVACEKLIKVGVQYCPFCGWTQP